VNFLDFINRVLNGFHHWLNIILVTIPAYYERGSSWFPSAPPGEYCDSTLITSRPLPSKSLPIHYHSPIILPSDSILKTFLNNLRKEKFITSNRLQVSPNNHAGYSDICKDFPLPIRQLLWLECEACCRSQGWYCQPASCWLLIITHVTVYRVQHAAVVRDTESIFLSLYDYLYLSNYIKAYFRTNAKNWAYVNHLKKSHTYICSMNSQPEAVQFAHSVCPQRSRVPSALPRQSPFHHCCIPIHHRPLSCAMALITQHSIISSVFKLGASDTAFLCIQSDAD
jgi:hypothetical protein